MKESDLRKRYNSGLGLLKMDDLEHSMSIFKLLLFELLNFFEKENKDYHLMVFVALSLARISDILKKKQSLENSLKFMQQSRKIFEILSKLDIYHLQENDTLEISQILHSSYQILGLTDKDDEQDTIIRFLQSNSQRSLMKKRSRVFYFIRDHPFLYTLIISFLLIIFALLVYKKRN